MCVHKKAIDIDDTMSRLYVQINDAHIYLY